MLSEDFFTQPQEGDKAGSATQQRSPTMYWSYSTGDLCRQWPLQSLYSSAEAPCWAEVWLQVTILRHCKSIIASFYFIIVYFYICYYIIITRYYSNNVSVVMLCYISYY